MTKTATMTQQSQQVQPVRAMSVVFLQVDPATGGAVLLNLKPENWIGELAENVDTEVYTVLAVNSTRADVLAWSALGRAYVVAHVFRLSVSKDQTSLFKFSVKQQGLLEQIPVQENQALPPTTQLVPAAVIKNSAVEQVVLSTPVVGKLTAQVGFLYDSVPGYVWGRSDVFSAYLLKLSVAEEPQQPEPARELLPSAVPKQADEQDHNQQSGPGREWNKVVDEVKERLKEDNFGLRTSN